MLQLATVYNRLLKRSLTLNSYEKWIKRSAFGLGRKGERLAFTSAETQGQELANALADIAR